MVLFLRLGLILTLALATLSARAAIEVHTFDDPALEARYTRLIDELRCPKCQNESISASNSMISKDMRAQVATLLAQGRSDDAVKAYMVKRFGDYVLYDPRLEARTWLLWGGPLLGLLLGGVIIWRVVRARRQSAPGQLSAPERARLEALLAAHDEPSRSREHPND
ncbi:cytochrome c-type biogenesis protein [Larsenimonas suaedae]|uniref:Cytochrome c-type biogenesis protein n=1 Tax=Larsenimonas suaedae TaxID=1851019 RepID=A0ABU1GU26_9GAMM|nr:cytochrome c-type biogenesis protein [Larsenimonas suaedae]MCM2971977.1 cytochrome c-type biogenesis protein CcmH [Larsenimonas suaedae]MDR5895529.1 cytochrome c-type biogenesis protein CcmH [Larsenimonas suaedae]